jgi:TM2 domain-containing membrane protein YozV
MESTYLPANMVHCRECGSQIARSATNCPKCGGLQRAAGHRKSRGVAAVLAFFLGGFGIHRFYLGQWWGLFYLLFFWTFIPAIVAFVECIVFLCTSEDSWAEKYG